jgi:hypothetical protein
MVGLLYCRLGDDPKGVFNFFHSPLSIILDLYTFNCSKPKVFEYAKFF